MFDEVKAYKNGANFIVPIFWATLYYHSTCFNLV